MIYRQRFAHSVLAGLAACLLILPAHGFGATVTGWIGTYTVREGVSTGSRGIYSFQWDAEQGILSAIHPAGSTASPSFLALHPNGHYLYAVNEHGSPAEADRITAFAIGDSASLTSLGSVSSMGNGPCHLSIDATGKWLFVANYMSGSIAVFPIGADGRLGEAQQKIQQEDSQPVDGHPKLTHAHEVVQSPDGHFLLSANLGLDKVFVYRFDAATGKLTANDPASVTLSLGSGPRHLVFSKDAHRVYVLTELTGKLVTFRWDVRRGSLTRLGETATLPAKSAGEVHAAELALSANGKFIYASIRGESNAIALFRIGRDGFPHPHGLVPTGGRTPRFIGIDPSGRFLIAANQDSNNIFTFRIDSSTGALTRQGEEVALPGPTDLVFAPAHATN